MYRLSRNFFTTTYTDEDTMSDWELTAKKYTALTLGVVPCASAYLALFCFKNCTNLITTYWMMGSIKLFSLSQEVVWGKYVPFPSGDSFNSRLAQYGSGEQIWTDLDTIKRALNEPETLATGEWTLEEWKQIMF